MENRLMQTARKFTEKAEDKKPFDPLLSHFLAGLEMKDYFFFQLPYESSPFNRYPCPDIPFDPPKMNVDTPDFEKYFYDLVSAVNATFDTEQVLSFLESIHTNAKPNSYTYNNARAALIDYLDNMNLSSLSPTHAERQFTRITKHFFKTYQRKEDATAKEKWKREANLQGDRYQFRKVNEAYKSAIEQGVLYLRKQVAEKPKKATKFIYNFFKENDHDFDVSGSSGGAYYKMSRDFIENIEDEFISLIPHAIQSHNKENDAFEFISFAQEKTYDKNYKIVSTTHTAMNEHGNLLPIPTRVKIDNLLLHIGITSETVEADNDKGYDEIDTSHRDIDAIFKRLQNNISQLSPSALKDIELSHKVRTRLNEYTQKSTQGVTFGNLEENFSDIIKSKSIPLQAKLDTIEKCVEQYDLETALNIMLPVLYNHDADKSLQDEIFGIFTSSRKELGDQAFYKLADEIHDYASCQDIQKSAKNICEKTLKRIHDDAVTKNASNGDEFSQRLSALTQTKKQTRQPKRP